MYEISVAKLSKDMYDYWSTKSEDELRSNLQGDEDNFPEKFHLGHYYDLNSNSKIKHILEGFLIGRSKQNTLAITDEFGRTIKEWVYDESYELDSSDIEVYYEDNSYYIETYVIEKGLYCDQEFEIDGEFDEEKLKLIQIDYMGWYFLKEVHYDGKKIEMENCPLDCRDVSEISVKIIKY